MFEDVLSPQFVEDELGLVGNPHDVVLHRVRQQPGGKQAAFQPKKSNIIEEKTLLVNFFQNNAVIFSRILSAVFSSIIFQTSRMRMDPTKKSSKERKHALLLNLSHFDYTGSGTSS